MKSLQITTAGTINKNGGLVLFMGEINEFLKDHKGDKVVVNFTVLKKQPSEALKSYYFACIVPTLKSAIWQSGDRKTDEQTELFLRELSPVMYEQTIDYETGKYNTRIKSVTELSSPELIEHIETIKQIAAEEYGVFVEDPKQYQTNNF